MQSGIMYSALDSMEGMIKRLEKIYGVRFKILLTGGFAPLIKAKSSHKLVVREDLVMDGINYIIRFNDGE
jgi:pantothenate kinase type III